MTGCPSQHSGSANGWLTITDGSIEHRLATKVMDVLLALAAAGGEVVTREILIDKVWGTNLAAMKACRAPFPY